MKLGSLFLLSSMLISSYVQAAEKVGEIFDTDRIQRRIEARDYSYFAFGPGSLSNLGVDDGGGSLSYGHIWETTSWAAITANLDGAAAFGDTAASIVTGTLGANFYLTPTAVSPYLGFGFGYGAAASSADGVDSVASWAGGASLGVALFRTSSTQMHISGRYQTIFKKNDEGQPSQASLVLGIAF